MQSRSRISSPESFATLTMCALALAGVACSEAGPPTTGTPPPDGVPSAPPVAPPPVDSQRAVLPISGGTLLVSRDGTTAVASDPDRDLISIVDLTTQKLRAQVRLEPGAEPGRLVEDNVGHVHVALRNGGAVWTLDMTRGRVLAQRALCAAPRGLAFEASTGLLHVACAGGELISIGALDKVPARTLHIDRDLRDVMVRGTDLLVTTFRKAELLVVNPAGAVSRLTPPKALAAFSMSRGLKGVPDVGPPGTGSPGASPTGMASPAVAYRMVEGPGGEAMVLHQRGVDDVIGTEPSSYGGGQSCGGIVETTVSTTVSTTTPGAGPMALRTAGALGKAVVAVDLAVSPDGRQVAVVSAGNAGTDQQLQFFDVADVSQPPSPGKPCVDGATVPAIDYGAPVVGPVGAPMVQKPVGYLPPNGEVVAVAYDRMNNVIVQSRQPATVQILTQRTPPIVLSTDVRADAGHQLFHTATSGQVACASCHPEGSEDARTWQFLGEGQRRTQSLRGGIMDTAPFHWSGTLVSLDHLMRDVFQGRMSGPAVARSQVAALSQWLDTVRTVKPSAWHEAAAAGRGKVLFESAAVGCASCHTGPDFTNGTTVDVGTGGSFQVAQLHNLAFRAPYLHDGCAATLADRFTTCGGGDKHGVTSQLSAAQLDDLVAYLETL